MRRSTILVILTASLCACEQTGTTGETTDSAHADSARADSGGTTRDGGSVDGSVVQADGGSIDAAVLEPDAGRIARPDGGGPPVGVLYEQPFDTASAYADLVHISENARHTHLSTGGWDGRGAAQFNLGLLPLTSSSQYAGAQYFDLPESLWQDDTIYVRWVCRFSRSTIEWMEGGVDKLLIIHRANLEPPADPPNPRIIAILNRYSSTSMQIFTSNNVDRDPPRPPLFTLEDRVDQWIAFEVGLSLRENRRRFWATPQGGDEILVQDEPLNRTDGQWTGGVEFGFWGRFTNADESTYWILDDLVISANKIGPPPGFAR